MFRDLISSQCRLDILELLQEEGNGGSSLDLECPCGSSTARRNLKILREEGWVEKEDGKHRLNPQREFLIEPLLKAMDLFGVYESAEDFWDGHDLDPIPDDLLEDLDDLAGGEVVSGTVSDPLRPLEEKERIIEESSDPQIVTPAYLPEYEDIALNIVESGGMADVLMTEEALAAFAERSDELSRDSIPETRGLRVLTVDRPLGFGLTFGDAGIALTLHRDDGGFDLSRSYVAEGERAIEWGRRLFGRASEAAEEFTSYTE